MAQTLGKTTNTILNQKRERFVHLEKQNPILAKKKKKQFIKGDRMQKTV